MSIRSNALPVGRDLAPELQEILRKNGMKHISSDKEKVINWPFKVTIPLC